MKRIQLVIPAAGLGSRFSHAGITTPKPILDVLGIPMIAWVIGNFKLQTNDSIVIITRPEIGIEAELAILLGEASHRIEFVYVDPVTEGPAISASLARSHLDLDIPLIIANSDQFVSSNLDSFVKSVRNSDIAGQILTMKAQGTKWSYIARDEYGLINQVKEKIEISEEATAGIYGWSKAQYFFDSLQQMIASNDRTNGEFYVAPTYNYLIKENLAVAPVLVGELENHVHGLGTPEDLKTFIQSSEINNYLHLVRSNLGLTYESI